jgi:dimethylamine/trimethylamine dehydrogenase
MSEIAFRATKAEGGWAAVCGGVISLRADSWGGLVPRIWDPIDRDVLAAVASEVQRHGALAGIELGRGGGRSEGEKFTPAHGVSQVADPENCHVVPKAMDVDEIHTPQDDWVAAAGVAADLGYAIVYAYGGHGTLPAQFLSPYFNRRTDSYGGSLVNRGRFWLELAERIRETVGDRCLVAARIAAEPFSPYGLSAAETLEFGRLADPYVDLWDVNVGFTWAADSAPFRLQPQGFQVEWTSRFREITGKPIVGVSRMTDPDAMADIIRSGAWDFIGAARPGIADPFLPRKIEEGRYDEIRECTGSNLLHRLGDNGSGLSCVQNATIGEEHRRGWHPERFSPPSDPDGAVLVVGAGPAGLECGRVLAERGFAQVHVVEAADEAGGHLRWQRRLPGLAGLGRVVDYRIAQLRRLPNAELILKRPVTAGDVVGYGADFIVVATGSHWIGPGGDERPDLPLDELVACGLEVLTPEEVEERPPRAGPVLVWDHHGGPVASGIAELLAAAGRQVTIATQHPVVAPLLDATFEGGGLRRRLHDLGVAVRTGVTVVGAHGRGVVVADDFDSRTEVDTTAVVAVVQRVSDDSLWTELSTRRRELGAARIARIGDCVSRRTVWRSVADGHRVGREIDGADATLPLPARREDDHDGSRTSRGTT